MVEKDFQREFSKWVRDHSLTVRDVLGKNCVFELKICKLKSISFDSVRENQTLALRGAIGRDYCYHKINDLPVANLAGNKKIRFTSAKPFDCFFISDAHAYVVIYFYKKNQHKGEREMHCVPFIAWQSIVERNLANGRKSAREEELREIGTTIKF